MTISLAFLAPNLVKAAVEGRLPRGIGVERLRDAPAEWSRQSETPRIESAIGSDAARSSLSADDPRAPAGQFRLKIKSPGPEFLGAETGGQESTRETSILFLKTHS